MAAPVRSENHAALRASLWPLSRAAKRYSGSWKSDASSFSFSARLSSRPDL